MVSVVSRKSIAAKLFLWLFIAGLGALLVGGSVLYFETRSIILSALDHTLESDAEIFSGLLHEESDGTLEFEYEEVISGDYTTPRSGHYYEVYVQEDLFASSPSLEGERIDLPSGRLEEENPVRGEKIFTATGPGGEAVRVLEKTGEFAGRPGKILVAHTMEESLEMLRRFRNLLLGFGPAATLLLALVGMLITSRSLRPLRTFSEAVRRITEKTLHQRMDTADQYKELSTITVSFNEMLDRLQQAIAAREDLLSEVSHELKTPVAVIRSHCDIYLQKPRPAGEYVEALEVIRQTAVAMGVKIRRLLSMAEIETDLLAGDTWREVSLADCLRQARIAVEPLARERQILISETIAPGLRVYGQELRLTEAFANLMENAIKYNRSGGRVDITARREGNEAKVKIEDTGCGIPSENITRIFDRFYRGNPSGEEDGTGLGLWIVRAIVEVHRGTVEATSRLGYGSCFTVTLNQIRNFN
jgi:signal transduction histidine kinase